MRIKFFAFFAFFLFTLIAWQQSSAILVSPIQNQTNQTHRQFDFIKITSNSFYKGYFYPVYLWLKKITDGAVSLTAQMLKIVIGRARQVFPIALKYMSQNIHWATGK